MSDELILFAGEGVEATRIGLSFSNGVKEPEWKELGQKLSSVLTTYQWMVGDWWNFGEKKFGNRKAFIESTEWNGPPYKSCANYGWVCKVFESSLRSELLTFHHHKEMAPLMVTDPNLAKKILHWCEAPVKKGKKPHSIAAMKRERTRRMSLPSKPSKKSKKQKEEQTGEQKQPGELDPNYLDFTNIIYEFVSHEVFDYSVIAKTQVKMFGSAEILAEDLEDCRKVIAGVSAFIEAVENLCKTQKKD